MFSVSVIVYSNCLIRQFLHQMFNVSTLLLDDALAGDATDQWRDQLKPLQQFAPLSDNLQFTR